MKRKAAKSKPVASGRKLPNKKDYFYADWEIKCLMPLVRNRKPITMEECKELAKTLNNKRPNGIHIKIGKLRKELNKQIALKVITKKKLDPKMLFTKRSRRLKNKLYIDPQVRGPFRIVEMPDGRQLLEIDKRIKDIILA